MKYKKWNLVRRNILAIRKYFENDPEIHGEPEKSFIIKLIDLFDFVDEICIEKMIEESKKETQ